MIVACSRPQLPLVAKTAFQLSLAPAGATMGLGLMSRAAEQLKTRSPKRLMLHAGAAATATVLSR